MVHQQVPIKKALAIDDAVIALDKEWNKLLKKNFVDFGAVMERSKCKQQAREKGITRHFGRVKQLCHIKNAELEAKFRKYKGRAVFEGDWITDEEGFRAVFTEQGASATQMASTKFLDAIARMPGCIGQDADAEGAYTQMKFADAAELLGEQVIPETWVSIPEYRWPDEWKKMGLIDPVVPLKVNLYGHPLAGLLWEKGCEAKLLKLGFQHIKNWENMYVHKAKQLFLSVYVDDFHLAGKETHLRDMWKLMGDEGIVLEDPCDFNNNVYLGCRQQDIPLPEDLVKAKREFCERILTPELRDAEGKLMTDQDLKIISHQMHLDWPKPVRVDNQKVHSVGHHKKSKSSTEVPSVGHQSTTPKIQAYEHQMEGAAGGCVDRYLELSGASVNSLKKVATPCLDDNMLNTSDFMEKGTLSKDASKAVLKCLYLARLARPEILWTVNSLAREVTKWTVACDKRLHRLISYLHHRRDDALVSFVGDEPKDCNIVLFCDASFAGDRKDSKSTSGCYMCLVGPNTFAPITWLCKKQGAVSHSSTEAEVVALDTAIRMEGLAAVEFWDHVISVLNPGTPRKH